MQLRSVFFPETELCPLDPLIEKTITALSNLLYPYQNASGRQKDHNIFLSRSYLSCKRVCVCA